MTDPAQAIYQEAEAARSALRAALERQAELEGDLQRLRELTTENRLWQNLDAAEKRVAELETALREVMEAKKLRDEAGLDALAAGILDETGVGNEGLNQRAQLQTSRLNRAIERAKALLARSAEEVGERG